MRISVVKRTCKNDCEIQLQYVSVGNYNWDAFDDKMLRIFCLNQLKISHFLGGGGEYRAVALPVSPEYTNQERAVSFATVLDAQTNCLRIQYAEVH